MNIVRQWKDDYEAVQQAQIRQRYISEIVQEIHQMWHDAAGDKSLFEKLLISKLGGYCASVELWEIDKHVLLNAISQAIEWGKGWDTMRNKIQDDIHRVIYPEEV